MRDTLTRPDGAPVIDWQHIGTLTGAALESALAAATGVRCEPDTFGRVSGDDLDHGRDGRRVHYVSPDDLHLLADRAPTAAPQSMRDAIADALASVRRACPDVNAALVLTAAMHADVVSTSGRIVLTRLARVLTGNDDERTCNDVRQALTLALAPVVSSLLTILDDDDSPAIVARVPRVVARPAHVASATVRAAVGTREVPWSQCERDVHGAPVAGGATWSGVRTVPVVRTLTVRRPVPARPALVGGTRTAIVSTGGHRQRDGLTTCTRAAARAIRRAWLATTHARQIGRVSVPTLDELGYAYDLGYQPVSIILGPVAMPPAARPAPVPSSAYALACAGTALVRDLPTGQGSGADGTRDALRRVPLAQGWTVSRERLASPIVGGSYVLAAPNGTAGRRPRAMTRDQSAALAATAALTDLRARLVR